MLFDPDSLETVWWNEYEGNNSNDFWFDLQVCAERTFRSFHNIFQTKVINAEDKNA